MPKKDETDEYVQSEYGTWNVAAEYSRLKIMRPLALADEYETISTFGHLDFIEEIISDFNPDVLKIRGFKRLIKTLILLINNSKFVVKGTHKDNLLLYKKELDRYYKVITTLFKHRRDDRKKTRQLVIIPEKYDPALDRVIEIKSLINEPLNRFDLIFTYKEQFDPKKAKAEIKKRLGTTG